MALVKCKECGQDVSSDAKACPHCGKKQAQSLPKGCFWCLGVFFLIFWIGVVASLFENHSQTSAKIENQKTIYPIEPQPLATEKTTTSSESQSLAPAAEPARKSETHHFPFTVDEFVVRYNKAVKVFGNKPLQIHVFKEDKDVKLVLQAQANENMAMVITGDPQTRMMESFTFIGTGNGTIDSGVNIIFGICASVMAVEDPTMPREERGIVLKQIGLSNKAFSEKGEFHSIRKGVKYQLLQSKEMGVWFTGEPN